MTDLLGWGFWGRRIEWRYFQFDLVQDSSSAAIFEPPSCQIQMAISPQRIIQFIPCLVLGWGIWGRQIKWCYFKLDQIQ